LRVLFITHTRIGDAVLSTGVLHRLVELYPEARVTIACGPLAVSLFAATPRLERIIPVTKRPFDGHWIKLWRDVRGETWDVVVDLRRSLVSYFLKARARRILGPARHGRHQVEYLSSVLGDETLAPSLSMDAPHAARAATLIGDGAPVLAVSPVAAKPEKTWPAERFAEAIAKLTAPGGVCRGWRVALFGADGDRTVAEALARQLGTSAQVICGESDLLTVYAAIARCAAFLGNDSGLGHLAACAGIPTLAVFGPTDAQRYAPWGDHCASVAAPDGTVTSVAVPQVVDAFTTLVLSRARRAG
jgi:ADP-heptose:LPS heptosyltransferase